MQKEQIFLTDITLHTRNYRPTVSFAKVAEKGRFYSPLPRTETTKTPENTKTTKISIPLPADLLEKHAKGELDILVPKDGLFMLLGDDVIEYLKSKEAEHRRLTIHRGRTWHSNDSGIK